MVTKHVRGLVPRSRGLVALEYSLFKHKQNRHTSTKQRNNDRFSRETMDASTSTVQAPQKQAASQKAEQTNETTTLGF